MTSKLPQPWPRSERQRRTRSPNRPRAPRTLSEAQVGHSSAASDQAPVMCKQPRISKNRYTDAP
jgi:hypothetical protein